MKRFLALVAILSGLAVSAHAQTQAPALAGYVPLAVDQSGERTSLPGPTSAYGWVTIYNAGSKTAYFAVGGATVSASTGSTQLAPGQALAVSALGGYVAGATGAGDSSTLLIYQSNAPIYLALGGASSGGGSSTVTANQGGVWSTRTQDGTGTPLTSTGAALDVNVKSSGVTQPVSAASLPLPAGAATSANQSTANGSLATIATNTTGVSTAANQATGNSSLASIASNTTGVALAANQTATQAIPGSDASKAQAVQGVTGGKAVAVSASALPLPANAAQETGGNLATIASNTTGAATAANQTAVQAAAGSPTATAVTVQGSPSGAPIPISGSITATNPSVGTNTAAGPASSTQIGARDGSGNLQAASPSNPLPVSLANTGANGTAVKVDGSAVTQPVSGTVTANAGTGTMAVSAASLPLPSGASTAANQTAIQASAGVDASKAVAVQGITGGTPVPISGSITATNPSVSTNGAAGPGSSTQVGALDGSGNLRPAGPSNPMPVTLANTGANATAVKVDGSAVTQPVSGTVTANAGSGTMAVSAAALPLPSGAATSANQPSNAAQASTTSGQTGTLVQGATTTAAPTYTTATTNPLSLTTSGALRTDSSASTQPVSGTVTVQQSTASNLKVDLSGTAANSTAIKVDGSAVTQPVSAASLPLPSGAATSANQPSNAAQGSTTSGQTGPLVQGAVTTAAPSYTTAQTSPLSLTTSGALRTDASGTTQPVSGTVTANAGSGTFNIQSNASVNVAQVAGTTTDTNSGNKSAGTQRVVLATDQPQLTNALKVDGSAVTQPVSAASLPLPSGAATATNQTNGQGTVAVGTAAANSNLSGCVYNSTAPSPTTGQGMATQCDAKGNARGVIMDAAGNTRGANVTAGNALVVDGSASTQPVSGTVTVQQATASNLKVDLSGTAANATAIKVDGSAVTQPVSGTVTANAGTGTFNIQSNASTNVAQVAGTTTDTNSGNKSAGTLRVVLATDQPQLTNKLLVTPDANSAINVAQVNGSTVSTAATGVQKVGVVGNAGATVDSTVAAGTAPTNAIAVGSVYNTSAPAPTNGQAMAQQADQSGNLRTAPGMSTLTLSAWNSSTSLNATQNIYTNSGAPAALVHLVQTSTLTAGAVTFEVTYDNSNWVTIPADAVLDPSSTSYAQIAVPYTVQASTNKAFLIINKGWQGLRAKLSTQITGTGSVTPNYALLPTAPGSSVIALSPTASNFNTTTNVSQVGGSNVSTAATGVQKVGIVGSTGTAFDSTAGVMDSNVKNVGGSAVSTAATGVQKVGIVGNGGATVDSAANASTLPTNLVATRLCDGAGNSRCGNVNASNQVSVSVDNSNVSTNIAQMNGVAVTMGNGASGTGVQRVTIASDSTGQIGTVPLTAGGLSTFVLEPAASDNHTNIKNGAGQVYGIHYFNNSATINYIRLYNAGTGFNGCNSATNLTWEGQIPANSTNAAGAVIPIPEGIAFGTGISICVTGAYGQTSTTAATASAISLDILYK